MNSLKDVPICRSCPKDTPFPAEYIGNAYARRNDGSSWDWPLCSAHVQHAMVAGWFPIRKVGESPPYDQEPRPAPEGPSP